MVAVSDLRLGSELAGYRLEAMIGRGGMGVVYRAEDLRLGRKVALKVLAPELAENEGFRERFNSESRLAAAIDHPHIIPLYEAGEAEGQLFLVMRFVDGIDLKALLEQEGPLSLQRALAIVAQIGGALDAAHARGLVHRDVKPANVLVSSNAAAEISEHCYLTDFGLTKDTSQGKGLTGTGQFVGTIDYAAPEQIEGAALSGATDQYALGCVLYELLTGHPPFERKSELDVLWAHLSEHPPSLAAARPDLPSALDAVLARAMAKVADNRYPSCVAMAGAARATPAGPTQPGRTVVTPRSPNRDATSPPPPSTPLSPPARPPDPVVHAPTPAVDRKPTPRRAALIAATLTATIAAAVGGALAGASRREGAPRATAVARTAALSLRVPDEWDTLRSPPGIPGLQFEDSVALGPRPARGREGLVAGRIASSGARLLPAELVAGTDGAAAARDVVRVGAADAFRYVGLRPTGFTGSVTLYLLLTDKGRVAIACYGTSPSSAFARRCAGVAASLQLIDREALTLAPSPRYVAALNDLLADVARRRSSAWRRLAAAAAAEQQARAAEELAATYTTAARRVLDLPVPAAAREANKAIADALRDLHRSYTTASEAARRRVPPRYSSASRAVRRGERSLRAAVGTLAELGYDVK